MDNMSKELIRLLTQARAIIKARVAEAAQAQYPYVMTVRGAGARRRRIGLHSRDQHHAKTCALIYAQDRDMVIEELIDNRSGAVISTSLY